MKNRVDGLTGFFTDEVRLSHQLAYGSRTTRFVKHNATSLYTSCIFVRLANPLHVALVLFKICLATGTKTRFKFRQHLIANRCGT